ncbi:signal peptidase I [Thalassotalea sp. HSM 43]|uniref:signal peptidase I n=1 Tax=Thalassotalea sp. HSM 43 TaxID=2552945 RepID=UPI001081FAA5|nr:signal peptidase I [Thalassotalea sp. HSM 43]QBY05076.1 signal peptidase I [Thalassotalea sp. HSM 43]
MAAYFSILLVVVTMITGFVYVLDKMLYAPKRKENLKATQQQCSQPLDQAAVDKILTPNAWIDTSVQVFPVIAFVLVLRSFLWEPFQIPSGSMMPTLLDGDFILVNKHTYGLRDPIARNKFVEMGAPERGDVVVFKYPMQPQIDYIKRVIGLPGDRIIYKNKSLYIQPKCVDKSQPCPKMTQVLTDFKQTGEYFHNGMALTRYESRMGEKTHEILINNNTPAQTMRFFNQPGRNKGEWLVPEGEYFVMGDNRDNSLDGRFWGFVPEENLVGEAVAIWMSFDFERNESDFLPAWIPTGVRFSRIGGIE